MKASDLPEEGSITVTIQKVEIEEIGREKQHKPVIYFYDHDKAFVCNKTNANTIAEVTGSRDFEDWDKKKISLGRSEVEAFGEMVEAIRVRLRTKNVNRPQLDEGDDDGIPF
jgi:hypothetical protein